MAFGILLRHAVVRKTRELVYLDVPVWEAHQARRRHRLLLIPPFLVLVGLVLWVLWIEL
jgi:hypothetical protein